MRKMFDNDGADRPVSRNFFGAEDAERPVLKKIGATGRPVLNKKPSMTWDPLKMGNLPRNLGHFFKIWKREKLNVFNWVGPAED